MASISLTVKHTLTVAEAKARIKKAIKEAKSQYGAYVTGVHESWEGDSATLRATVRGYELEGTVQVDKDHVEVTGDLPFMFSMFKAKIETMITQEAKNILA